MDDIYWDYWEFIHEKQRQDTTLYPHRSEIHEKQRHDANVEQNNRRENSVNMNLEVEDPLYATVQRRSKTNNNNNHNNRQG